MRTEVGGMKTEDGGMRSDTNDNNLKCLLSGKHFLYDKKVR